MTNFLAQNFDEINKKLKGSVAKLIAVSKTKPVELLQEAYQIGIRRFGENKAQEMAEKYHHLPKDIEWHMIGHLQTNKVKYIAPFVFCIHSVDSLKLLIEIDKQAAKNKRIINCLLQVYIASEETKFGLSKAELIEILDYIVVNQFENIKIIGLMGMASNTLDQEKIAMEFASLKQIFDEMKLKYEHRNIQLNEISMGMSSDYEIALNYGSTMIRVGSSLFGERQLH